jgi:hypothetical protein
MKSVIALSLAVVLTFAIVVNVGAQSTESIWLTANPTAYKTGETVIAAVNAASATPIQGFTFQIRYDPACLRPVNAVSNVPGMNALPLPQISGLADGSYASTTPQTVNGTLAEVRFTALKGCQTNLTLESAALAIRNESGFAAPLPSVAIGEKNVALNIDKEVVTAQSSEGLSGAVLPLEPRAVASAPQYSGWLIALLLALVVGVMFGAFKLFQIGTTAVTGTTSRPTLAQPSQMPTLQIKHGPNAGKNFTLNKLPCFIGRDTINEIRLDDPHIIGQHVKIFEKENGYYLMDLGGETFINGQAVRRSAAVLKSGDVVRLGKSALLVFGS